MWNLQAWAGPHYRTRRFEDKAAADRFAHRWLKRSVLAGLKSEIHVRTELPTRSESRTIHGQEVKITVCPPHVANAESVSLTRQGQRQANFRIYKKKSRLDRAFGRKRLAKDR